VGENISGKQKKLLEQIMREMLSEEGWVGDCKKEIFREEFKG